MRLTNLEWLSMAQNAVPNDHAPLNDETLKALKGLTKLHYLDLRLWKITDDGLKHLQGLGNLAQLSLDGTAVTDAGLMQLKGMQKLESISASETKVTKEGIAAFNKILPKCKVSI